MRKSYLCSVVALKTFGVFAGAHRVPKDQFKERVSRMLVEMDLEGYREAKAGRLSDGYSSFYRRLALWFTEPTLLFLDEPTAGLDPVHRQLIWDVLYKVTQSGTTVFVTAHYMDESERCTDVGFSSGGGLIAKGSPRHLKKG